MNFALELQQEMDKFIEEVDKSQKTPGGPSGYRLRRIILANFWFYKLQVFEIPHGRLLLTGNNGSGKSTVLAATLPLALEGDYKHGRLDTFAGYSKNIEYYVLGDEAFRHKTRTSYVALEFEWCLSDVEAAQVPELEIFSSSQHKPQEKARYLTMGISLVGNETASNPIRHLYFLITDGSRLIKDIKLTYTDSKNQTQTYNHQDFKASLKGHGITYDSQEKYAQEVSTRLFGFDDLGRFRKLIKLLLMLRRPNPSDNLTVEKVQEHLTDALPQIPSNVAKEAVETIGEIDNLQQKIEQLDQEYQAVSDLHHAQQKLVLREAKNAGFSCKISHQLVEELNSLIASCQHDLTSLEVQYRDENSKHEKLRIEKESIAGKITAIELSEGAKAANQIIDAQNHVQSTREQVEKQLQILERAQRRLQHSEEALVSQNKQFQDQLDNCRQQMQNLSQVFEKKLLWYEVVEQFQVGLEYLSHVTSEGPDTVEIIQKVGYLTEVDIEVRLQWLQELDRLHQEKKNLEQDIEHAQMDERRCSREADRYFSQFKDDLGNFFALSHQIELTLENILINAGDQVADTRRLTDDHADLDGEHSLDEKSPFEDISDVNSSIERCAEQLQRLKQYIESNLHFRNQRLQKWKNEIDSLRLEKGLKGQNIRAKEQEYNEKKNQPEILPAQPEHRKIAREKLAVQKIPAFPLYSLVDMVSECESEEAGYIEQMLEDTGLLDALVILDEDIPLADNLLQMEGLSDYRLNAIRLEQILAENAVDSSQIPVGRWLQFDSAVCDAMPTTYQKWEATVNKLIPLIKALLTLPANLTSDDMMPMGNAANMSGKWQHGLLSGQSSGGKVRFIGKMARQRARQEELDKLLLDIATLKSEFTELTNLLAEREERLKNFSAEQEEIRTLIDNKGLSISLQGLKNIAVPLNTAQKNYQKAQEQTRKKRQESYQLTMKLQEQSGSILIFARDHDKVCIALQEAYKLGTPIGLLQQGLQLLITVYKAIQETKRNLQEASIDKGENQTLYDNLQDQFTRHEFTLEMLQEIINSPQAKDLTNTLEALRRRAKELDDEILKIAQATSRSAERTKNLSEILTQKQGELQAAQVDMHQKQMIFKDTLTTYPVPELQDALVLVNEGKYTIAVQSLLRDTTAPERLPQELLDARSLLHTIHMTHMNLLLEYGPDLDRKTFLLTFSQENGATPSELLDILDTHRKIQQELFKAEEIKLYESFLLKGMTDVLYNYIREAREWVDQMNEPLQRMVTVQDRYELEWQAKLRLEEVKLGSYLAKHQKLFNKHPSKLTEEERDLLKVAFKQEIHALSHPQDENTEKMKFEQRLQAIFDYRQWFQFKVYITSPGKQKYVLTNKTLGERSGAERLFDLLVPLLAAVTSLYNNAATGAPRLLALDEAFDRVSPDNIKEFVEYLADQDFQWIMTGPDLNISGTQVPVSVRYNLLHEKGKSTATAVSRIWKSRQTQ